MWPPPREEEETWAEYFERYRTLCKPAEALVKADPARGGQREERVTPEEAWAQERQHQEAAVEAAAARWEKLKEERQQESEAREARIAEVQEELMAAAEKRAELMLPAENNAAAQREALRAEMKGAKELLAALTEALPTIEVQLEDVEEAEPPEPSQVVLRADEELLKMLLVAAKGGNRGGWASGLAALRDAEHLPAKEEPEEGEEPEPEVKLDSLLAFHGKELIALLQREYDRIKLANREEEQRLKDEAAEAAEEEEG